MAGRTYTVELPWIPSAEVRGNSRAYWRKKHTKSQELKASGKDHMNLDELRGVHLSRVRITFHFTHNRSIDLDNLAIGMKYWVDGLIYAGLVEDDSPEYLTYGSHTFTKAKGESQTLVEIVETDLPTPEIVRR